MGKKKLLFWGLGGLAAAVFAELWTLWSRNAPGDPPLRFFTPEHFLVTVGIFVLLFLWLGVSYEEGRRQPDWMNWLKQKNWKEILPEVITRLLMSVQFLLIFYLMSGKTADGGEIFKFIPFSLILGYVFGICSTEGKARKALAVCVYVFLAFYTIHHLNMTGKVRYIYFPFDFGIIYEIKPYLELVGAALILPALRKNIYGAVIFTAFNLLLYPAYLTNGVDTSFYFTGFIFLSVLFISPRTTSKVMLGTMLAFALSVAVFLGLGWVEDMLMPRHGGVYHTLGLVHTNSVAMVIANITLLVWILWLRRRPWRTLAVFTGVGLLVRYVTDCRTVTISLFVFGVVHLLYCLVLKKRKEKCMAALIPVYLICTAVCFVMISLIGTLNGKVDGSFLSRFTGPVRAMTDHPVQLFGTTVYSNDYAGLENNYLHTIIRDGVVPFTLCIGLMTWMMYRFYKNRQYDEMLVMVYYAAYSFMENMLFTCYWNFGVMLCLFFAQAARRGDGTPEPAAPEIAEKG